MKALIFNSGIGKRMGDLTKKTHKSLVSLHNGETIFERQIRILSECGIKDIVVTTGPYADKLKDISFKKQFSDIKFTFVNNPIYDKTNYIYSFYLAKEHLDDDFLVLHGDLVFNKKLVTDLLKNDNENVGLINKLVDKPEKDFKARVVNSKIVEVSIDIFDENCYSFQPLYKLSKKSLNTWILKVEEFINDRKIDTVYAENALNEISDSMNIVSFDYSNYFIEEIDNPEDYNRVVSKIRLYDFNEQEFYDNLIDLNFVLKKYNLKRPFIVAPDFFKDNIICNMHNTEFYYYFSDFSVNPNFGDAKTATNIFVNKNCDSIISIGGGSAIDTGKAIKYLICQNDFQNIKHIVIPTTAGTGSESTRYSVVYENGVKKSLSSDAIYPDIVILDSKLIISLPDYQKKCTMLDALCHCIESIWSINSTYESIKYAKEAINLIKINYKKYLQNDISAIGEMQIAANKAGRAINITQTTAAHAMSYKLTSLFNLPHGHAVALTIPYLWKFIDEKINIKMNINISEFMEMYNNLNIHICLNMSNDIIDELVKSVNVERLVNFPVRLTKDDIKNIYKCL